MNPYRRRSKTFVQASSGSVSVYFIAATAAFVLLTGLLIDFARIAAFRKQAELAVQSGVRSVLSSFDPVIYEKYGLFIRGGDDGTGIFRAAAEGHFTDRQSGGAFEYLAAGWPAADIAESRPLADHDVFRRQVMEEMKYKAPIDLTLELANRFRGISPALKETARTVGVLEKMRVSYDRREARLDEALAGQRHAGGEIVSLLRTELLHKPFVRGRNDSANKLLAEFLANAAGRVRSAAETSNASSLTAWRSAKEANDEMRAVSNSSSDGGQSVADAQGIGAGATDALVQLRQTAAELVLPDAFFNAYAEEIVTQQQQESGFADQIIRISSLLAAETGSGDLDLELRTAQSKLKMAAEFFADTYGETGSILRDREAKFGAHRSRDQERREQESAARSEWSGWNRLIGGAPNRTGREDERKAFQRVQRLSQINLQWNRTPPTDSPANAETAEPSVERDRAIDRTDGWLEALDGSLSGTRDALYFSEYAMGKLSRFPPSKAKRLLEGEDIPLLLEDMESEYILYGRTSPTANITSAYGEIFAFRLAIRTLEGLVECRFMGHPLLVLAAALAYGIRHAVLDIRSLLERGTVPLSKYVKVDTAYPDYLRLFLLLHGSTSSHLSRQIAVIEYRTGLDFSKAYTYVSGEGTASLRLWFFPGLLKMLGRTGQLGGTVKGNRYEAAYTADSAYQ